MPTMESLAGALRRMGLKAAASGIMGEQELDRASPIILVVEKEVNVSLCR